METLLLHTKTVKCYISNVLLLKIITLESKKNQMLKVAFIKEEILQISKQLA